MKKILIILPVIFISLFTLFSGPGINAKEKIYKIGDKGPAGGWIFYDKGNNSSGWRYLEAAPEDIGKFAWGCITTKTGAIDTAIGTGKTNTQKIAGICKEPGSAANKAAAYRGGGKSDWFLPSKDEAALMYKNLYEAEKGGFIDEPYWSSSEVDDSHAWYQGFFTGSQTRDGKKYEYYVRPVRAF